MQWWVPLQNNMAGTGFLVEFYLPSWIMEGGWMGYSFIIVKFMSGGTRDFFVTCAECIKDPKTPTILEHGSFNPKM